MLGAWAVVRSSGQPSVRLAALVPLLSSLASVACGDSAGSDPQPDVVFGLDAGDAGDLGELGDFPDRTDGDAEPERRGLGEPCEVNEQCLSDLCAAFALDRICSEVCVDTCPAVSELVCFDELCAPADFCDDSGAEPVGPGCEGSPCDACDPDGGTCVQGQGGFACACRSGYTGDGLECTDIDECATGGHDCIDNAACTNTGGGFNCACPEGYEGDGRECTDIDECDRGLADCDENARCQDVDGGFTCICNTGWRGLGDDCEEIDECAEGTHECDENAACSNTPAGDYTCLCRDGWEGDGETCADEDECVEGTHDCDENALCANDPPGRFTCTCADGWEGTGTECTLGLSGALTLEEPGRWADGTVAASCQDYRYPAPPRFYEGDPLGDGWYDIAADPESDSPTTVFCDMTTDGGGWTAIDAATAADLGAAMTALAGGCAVVADQPATDDTGSDAYCRYDVPVPFEFNTIRLEGVVIEALAAVSNTADVTQHSGDWGAQPCLANRGDVVWGTPAHTGGVLSLGAWLEVSACAAGPSFSNGVRIDWDEEAVTTLDDVLRLEMAEFGTETEGWRWAEGRVWLRREVEIVGALTAEDPGIWQDDVSAEDCWGYRYPAGSIRGYLGSTGDGYYTITPGGASPVVVWCDMTTDGGGWTGIDPATAVALGGVLSTVSGTGCSLADGVNPEVYGLGATECRYDVDLGFTFNEVRTDEVVVAALAGDGRTSDLTWVDAAWGTSVCGSRGDVLIGGGAQAGAALSLGAYRAVAACGDGGSWDEGDFFVWDDDEAPVGEDTVLRLEMGQNNPNGAGWRWSGGRFLVRRGVGVAGALNDDSPGTFADGSLAESCLAYRRPVGPYVFLPAAGPDGTYTIDMDGHGPGSGIDVFCDMTTDGGGWTAITLDMARNRLGGVLASPGGVQQPVILEFDAQHRPRSQDQAGDHTANYTFSVPFGFEAFYLASYQARAFGGGGANVSDMDTASFVQTTWALANGAAWGDISFGDGNAAGPVTSFAAEGVNNFQQADATLDFPGGTTIYEIAAPSTSFRMGWGEGGGQVEGWYPWWTGTVRVR